MKYSLLFRLGMLIISLVIVQSPQAKGNPKLVCDETTYNFGEVVNTKTIKYAFVLKNKGDAPLIISRVRAACGCTTTNISNKTIAPGKEATLDVELSLRGYEGHVEKDVRILSDDPENPELVLHLEGTAIVEIAEIEIASNFASFGYIAEGATATRTVNITAVKDKPFKITKVETDSTHYDIKLETVEDGKSYRLQINLKPQSSKKNISDKIYVFTDNPKYEKIEITASANIFGLFAIIPEEIILSANTDKSVTKYIVIYSTENKPFHIKSATAPISSIQTQVFPMANGYSIQISNIEPTEELSGKNLHITTDLEGEKEILIPFRIMSSEK